jgi:hypothetical protein
MLPKTGPFPQHGPYTAMVRGRSGRGTGPYPSCLYGHKEKMHTV